MKAISTRLKALNEDLSRKYKARNKLQALLPLKQFEQVRSFTSASSSDFNLADLTVYDALKVSEDFMFDVATQLLDSRKSGLLQLANAITKRIAGT